jgi:hypothetical protein
VRLDSLPVPAATAMSAVVNRSPLPRTPHEGVSPSAGGDGREYVLVNYAHPHARARRFRVYTSRRITPTRLSLMWRWLGFTSNQWRAYYECTAADYCRWNPAWTEAEWYDEICENRCLIADTPQPDCAGCSVCEAVQ